MGGLEEAREKYLRLPFAYPGNKTESLKHILPHLPYGKGYGEPFGGSGVVLLNRQPSKLEVYNDRYGGVVALYRVVRDRELYPRFMERIKAADFHSREEFIWCKRTWANCEDDVERAARWYYMVRFAVNGKAEGTFGRGTSVNSGSSNRIHNSFPLFGPISSRLRHVTIENMDWSQLISDYDQPGFVWYMDPTYLDSYTSAYIHELSVADHKLLVRRISELQGFVAVSSYEGPATKAVYDVAGLWDDRIEWDRSLPSLTKAFRETNNFAGKETYLNKRESRKELLWIRRPR